VSMNIIKASSITAVAWLIMIGHARYRQLSPYKRRVFAIGVISLAAIGVARLAIHATRSTLHPPVWDFVLFWINGTIASQGLNFYDPALAAQVAAPFHPDVGFVKEAVNTPFLYPPPSIVWFVPLGWLEIHTAAGAWYAVHLACLAASIIVLSLTFLETISAINVAFITTLVLMVHGTDWNVENAQTVFLLLLFISLAFRHRNGTVGGVWLALAILVKPFMAIVVLYAVLLRKWRPLAAAAATLLLVTFGIFIAFGRTVFASYAAIRFQALPMEFYTEIDNQSLLAWIVRITHSPIPFPPVYTILAALSGAILLWRLSTVKERNEPAGFALALIFGLLLYPASLRSYTVVLILPILVLYAARLWIPIALAYSLMFLGQGNYIVLATLVIGLALAVKMPGLPVEASNLSESCPSPGLL
jgi:hypothetical protein